MELAGSIGHQPVCSLADYPHDAPWATTQPTGLSLQTATMTRSRASSIATPTSSTDLPVDASGTQQSPKTSRPKSSSKPGEGVTRSPCSTNLYEPGSSASPGTFQRRHWRSRNRHDRAIERLTPGADTTDPSDTIIERIDAVNDLARLRRRLESLSNNHREVLQLSIWEELSYDEIAVVLDVPIGTVRSRLARARQKLALDGTPPVDRASASGSTNSSNHDPNDPHIERTTR